MNNLKAGQVWHVRFRMAKELSTIKIVEVTDLTIAYKYAEPICSLGQHRRLINDIEFIEQVSVP